MRLMYFTANHLHTPFCHHHLLSFYETYERFQFFGPSDTPLFKNYRDGFILLGEAINQHYFIKECNVDFARYLLTTVLIIKCGFFPLHVHNSHSPCYYLNFEPQIMIMFSLLILYLIYFYFHLKYHNLNIRCALLSTKMRERERETKQRKTRI